MTCLEENTARLPNPKLESYEPRELDRPQASAKSGGTYAGVGTFLQKNPDPHVGLNGAKLQSF